MHLIELDFVHLPMIIMRQYPMEVVREPCTFVLTELFAL
jgi:hypothetical protein